MTLGLIKSNRVADTLLLDLDYIRRYLPEVVVMGLGVTGFCVVVSQTA